MSNMIFFKYIYFLKVSQPGIVYSPPMVEYAFVLIFVESFTAHYFHIMVSKTFSTFHPNVRRFVIESHFVYSFIFRISYNYLRFKSKTKILWWLTTCTQKFPIDPSSKTEDNHVKWSVTICAVTTRYGKT